ncbi:nucleotidyl transferase AbiEii/AbiGii toxin family protein [Salana multivorans]
MEHPEPLTAFQVDLAGMFFSLDAATNYLVAGGAALLASELITRPTEDLDLFAAAPVTSVTPAKEALVQALEERGYGIDMVEDWSTFCRMVVTAAGNECLIDLAINSPPHRQPTMTVLGPTLAPLELAGRKLLAIFGRAEARDFADVYVLARRFGRDALVEQARELDEGVNPAVLAQMIDTFDRFDDDEVPLDRDEVPLARRFFARWVGELR